MPNKRTKSPSVALPWEQNFGAALRAGRWPRLRVVLPVVLLFALGATILWKARYDAQVRETRGAIGVAHRAVLAFRDREGRCPRSIEELLHPPSTGSHFLHAVPLDGWGHPLWIRCHGDGRADEIEVISAGPNGAWGDDDNIR